MKKDFGFMVMLMTITLIAYVIACLLLCECRADDYVAIQTAINNDTQLPQGSYTTATTLYIAKSAYLNWHGVTIVAQCTPAIEINTPYKVEIDGLTLWVQANGIGINVEGNNQGSKFTNDDIYFGRIGFNFVDAGVWNVNNGTVQQFSETGIQVAYASTPNGGDSTISGEYIATANGHAGCVSQTSGDGLRIENCKLIGGIVGYLLKPAAGALGDLFIVGCSIENQQYGILVLGAYQNVVIQGDELMSATYGIMLIGSTGIISGNAITALSIGVVLVGSPRTVVGQNMISAPTQIYQ